MLEGTILINITPTTERIDEIKIEDVVIGDGDTVQAGQSITAHYTGAKMNSGKIFQSSLDSGSPFTAPLDNLIAGWQKGIPGMKIGGTRRLLIPADLAYGENPGGGTPGGDLIFEIQLISIG